MRALGLDLSLNQPGYFIGDYINGEIKPITFGAISTKHLDSHEQKLAFIYEEFNKLTKEYQPDVFVSERQFSGWNPQTLVSISECHGVIRLICGQNNKLVVYYPPQSIRAMVIEGFSTKDESGKKKTRQQYKKEIADEMFRLFGEETFGENPPDDITDAASVVVCFFKKNPNGYTPPEKKTKRKKVTEPKEKKTKRKKQDGEIIDN